MKLTKQTTIIAIAAAVVILLAVGSVSYLMGKGGNEKQNNDSQPTDTTETETKQSELPKEEAEEPAKEGTITGSLTYPSEGIPSGLVVHAYNIDTHADFFVKDHIKDRRFKYGTGYTMTVPAGKYYVYGVFEEAFPDQRAYYDEFIKCGADFTKCKEDYTKIVVTVEPGKESEDAIVGDWYNPCVIPGGKQPTEKFDLPTC